MDPRLDHSRMDHPRAPPLPPATTTTGAAAGEFRMDHHHHHQQQQQQQQQQQPRMLVELTGGGGRVADPRMMDARMMGQSAQQQHHQHHQHQQGGGRAFEFGFTSGGGGGRREARTLEDLFHGYGVRMATLAKMTEMGFTVSTLVNMTEGELDDVIHTIAELLQMELLVGERYGVKSAIRAEKRHLDEDVERQRLELLTRTDRKRKLDDIASVVVMPPKEGVGASEQRRESMMVMPDAVSPVNPLNLNSKEPSLIMGAGHNSLTPSLLGLAEQSSDSEDKRSGKKRQKRRRPKEHGEDGEDRPREHPFIVTEPGEAARGKKNGLDYLFDLYEQCGKFLEQVQQLAREKGEKCPTKVTNQVFRHAKHTGAGYINKPKMRHYVHCYALHCLDVDQSNGMRKLYKERGENVGAWRMACYPPLVAMARDNGWDIEGLFNRNDRLRIWYVPTKLRQLCHVDKGKLESREE